MEVVPRFFFLFLNLSCQLTFSPARSHFLSSLLSRNVDSCGSVFLIEIINPFLLISRFSFCKIYYWRKGGIESSKTDNKHLECNRVMQLAALDRRLCDIAPCDRCDKQLYSNKTWRGVNTLKCSDQSLTHDPAHSQLLIVTRRIWRIIIRNNLLPWWLLTLMASNASSSCPALSIEALFFSPFCPLKVLRIRVVHYHFNLLFNPFNRGGGGGGWVALCYIWPGMDVCFTAWVFFMKA